MSNSIRIPVPTPILKVAADSDGPYTFSSVAAYVPSSGPGYLAATDGRRAALVPVDIEGDRPSDRAVSILPAVAVATCKRTRKGPIPTLTVNGAVSTAEGTTYPTDHTVRFPPLADVLPTADKLDRAVSVTLNPRYLAELATALGSSDRITLVFKPHTDRAECVGPIVVMAPENPNVPGPVGLLMPCGATGPMEETRLLAIKRCDQARTALATAIQRHRH